MIEYISSLIESIKTLRLASKTDTEEYINNNALLVALKALALSKQKPLEDLTDVDFLDVVKSRFKSTRKAVIQIIAKTDKDNIGTEVAYIKQEEGKPDINITYDELTIEEIKSLCTESNYINTLINELIFLNGFIPKQLTEEEIRLIISTNKLTNIKDIMTYFRSSYPARYDNKLLATISKSL